MKIRLFSLLLAVSVFISCISPLRFSFLSTAYASTGFTDTESLTDFDEGVAQWLLSGAVHNNLVSIGRRHSSSVTDIAVNNGYNSDTAKTYAQSVANGILSNIEVNASKGIEAVINTFNSLSFSARQNILNIYNAFRDKSVSLSPDVFRELSLDLFNKAVMNEEVMPNYFSGGGHSSGGGAGRLPGAETLPENVPIIFDGSVKSISMSITDFKQALMFGTLYPYSVRSDAVVTALKSTGSAFPYGLVTDNTTRFYFISYYGFETEHFYSHNGYNFLYRLNSNESNYVTSAPILHDKYYRPAIKGIAGSAANTDVSNDLTLKTYLIRDDSTINSSSVTFKNRLGFTPIAPYFLMFDTSGYFRSSTSDFQSEMFVVNLYSSTSFVNTYNNYLTNIYNNPTAIYQYSPDYEPPVYYIPPYNPDFGINPVYPDESSPVYVTENTYNEYRTDYNNNYSNTVNNYIFNDNSDTDITYVTEIPNYVPPSPEPSPSVPSLPGGDGGDTNFWDFLIELLSSIGNVFNDLLYAVGNIVSSILDGLKNLLMLLFVPKEDFWQASFDGMKVSFEDKLPYEKYVEVISSLEAAAYSSQTFSSYGVSSYGDSPDSIFTPQTLSLMGTEVEFAPHDFISEYIPRIQSWIRGLFYLILAYYNYRQIIFLIRGTTYSSIGNPSKG